MSLEDALNRLAEPLEGAPGIESPGARERAAEWRAGVEWRGSEGTLTTPAVSGAEQPEWRAVLEIFELDPDGYEIVEPVLFNAWHGLSATEGQVLMRQWKARIIRRRSSRVDLAGLEDEIRKHKPRKRTPAGGSASLVIALADWQIGKRDGDGLTGTVRRVLEVGDLLEQRIRNLRRIGHEIGSITILGLGDLVEGCGDDWYPSGTFNAEADRREQVKIARRLFRDIVIRASRLVPEVTVAAIGGNHGENRRKGSAYTTPSDNDDIALVEQVAEILATNPETYGHVRFAIPKDRPLALTLEVAGHILGITHGHLARSSGAPEERLRRWLSGQALGRYPIGDSDILVTGHYHHLRIADWGGALWLQAPALDGGSDWFSQTTGQHSKAGTLTFLVTPEIGATEIEILR